MTLRGATGIARAPLIRVPAITAFDRVRTDFVVAAHDFPPGTVADGLLGLDFFRGLVLRLDFARGRITLDPPKRWWQVWRGHLPAAARAAKELDPPKRWWQVWRAA